ncbi:hypothetical protein LIER_39972 [Lithospermum erythrorhizon]|uniref:Uncharacterized protein n=1 Tax=Lithospermum erythrorhizon TaxID=34254 RepID=A0AAV3QQ96_LITER
MNDQYNVTMQVELPAKRKRGRPPKDVSIAKEASMHPHPVALAPKVTMEAHRVKSTHPNEKIGEIVTGVIDGIFDAGYLITVRIGNNSTPLHGVAFQPGCYVPLAPANDIAPQARTYQRGKDIFRQMVIISQEVVKSTDVVNQSPSSVVQLNQELISKIKSHSSPPLHNLRMVEQDEVMQVFEVSTSSMENSNIIDTKDANDDIYQGASDVQNKSPIGCQIESDSFMQDELKRSFVEVYQSSMGTNNPEEVVLSDKKERVEELQEILVSQVQSQEGSQAEHRTIESGFQQPSAFIDDLHQPTPLHESVPQEHHQQVLETFQNTANVGLHQCPQVLESHQESILPVDSELQANKLAEQNGLTNSRIELKHETNPLPECIPQENHQQEAITFENPDNVGLHHSPPVLERHQQSVLNKNSELQTKKLVIENGLANSRIEQQQQSSMFNESQLTNLVQEPIGSASSTEKQHSLEHESTLQAPPFSAKDTPC